MKKLTIFLVATLALAGCEQGAKKTAPQQKAPEVGAVEIKSETVKLTGRLQGRIEPTAKVMLMAQVSGVITDIKVQEGDKVKKGETIAIIDREPYKAAVNQQESLVKQAESALDLAEVKYSMAKMLAGKEVLSDLDQEQVKVDRDVASAALATAKANLESARINLERSIVVAPFDGVVGEFQREKGDLVGPLAVGTFGGIVHITANDNVQVYAQLDEKQHYEFMRRQQEEGFVPDLLEIELPDGTRYDYTGKLDYIGTEVSKTTGTVTYRAQFPNPKGLLLGGQNVGILITVAKPEKLVLIPQAAVQEDQVGRYVYSLDETNVVKKTYISVGERVGENWAVSKGLVEGDKIIVNGLLKAKPGKQVAPVFN
ncbi:efflux RND transporter periplasmic adaptor subunit [Thalassotalea sp. PLHSN55]|uniref:efflux RND transporter periplasmic adaptor subunit n=1 Tax=Thalassotalea sp. PLHSN55 TaxID=3435888 RepID=UPI003F8364A0